LYPVVATLKNWLPLPESSHRFWSIFPPDPVTVSSVRLTVRYFGLGDHLEFSSEASFSEAYYFELARVVDESSQLTSEL
jgi:hypothetical protein